MGIDETPDKEEQCRMVRDWCRANGVCPPAKGWEWTWFQRLFVPSEVIRAVPTFSAVRSGITYP